MVPRTRSSLAQDARRTGRAAIGAAIFLLTATSAQAQTGPSSPAAGTDERVWYGWQTLAADLPTLVLFDVGVLTKRDVVAGVGLSGFALATPGIHFAHQATGPGIVSLASRLVLPLGGFAVGRLVLVSATGMADRTKTAIGVSAGAAAAAAIDAVWLAWSAPRDNEYHVYVGQRPRWDVVPWVSASGGGVTMFGQMF